MQRSNDAGSLSCQDISSLPERDSLKDAYAKKPQKVSSFRNHMQQVALSGLRSFESFSWFCRHRTESCKDSAETANRVSSVAVSKFVRCDNRVLSASIDLDPIHRTVAKIARDSLLDIERPICCATYHICFVWAVTGNGCGCFPLWDLSKRNQQLHRFIVGRGKQTERHQLFQGILFVSATTDARRWWNPE
jgi:hypothetical protein